MADIPLNNKYQQSSNQSLDPAKLKDMKLQVYIRSRTKTFYKDSAKSLTTSNAKGEMDVLPLHTNFVSIVKDYVILDKGLPTEQKFNIDSGVLSVQDGNIDLYVGI